LPFAHTKTPVFGHLLTRNVRVSFLTSNSCQHKTLQPHVSRFQIPAGNSLLPKRSVPRLGLPAVKSWVRKANNRVHRCRSCRLELTVSEAGEAKRNVLGPTVPGIRMHYSVYCATSANKQAIDQYSTFLHAIAACSMWLCYLGSSASTTRSSI
jgi:hypothetical protein